MGYPYVQNPLDDIPEGESRPGGFDCMTFVENCLALAISDQPSDFQDNLLKIRYLGGIPEYHRRNHFASADWIPGNSNILKPANIGAKNRVRRTIDRGDFFRKKGRPLPPGNPLAKPQESELEYFAAEELRDSIERLPDCGVAVFISPEEWLLVAHMGLFFAENGEIELFHASLSKKVVEKRSLTTYLAMVKRFPGVSFLDILFDDNS